MGRRRRRQGQRVGQTAENTCALPPEREAPDEGTGKGEGSGSAPSPFALAVFGWVRIVAWGLVSIDVGALTILLWRLDVPFGWAFVLALLAGGFGTYKAQFSQLLSRKAFLAHRSPGRHLAMAALCLAANLSTLWLVGQRFFGAYAVARVSLGILVFWAWGSRMGERLLGDAARPPRQPA